MAPRTPLVAAFFGLALLGGLIANAPTAAAVSCAPAVTSTVTETSGGVTRTYTRSIVTATSSCEWTVPADITSLDLLVVGGGGGGGGGVLSQGAGGGGGGGEVVESTLSVTPGVTLTLTVGQGGTAGRGGQVVTTEPYLTGGMAAAGNGGPSSVSGTDVSLSAAGGRAGGNGTKIAGALTYSGAGGNSGSGNLGGAQNWDGAGGGAGQGGAGGIGVDIGGVGGDGGAGGGGVSSTISGATQWYGAGGGGGGSLVNYGTALGTGAAGGSGVGGHGCVNSLSASGGRRATAGAANSGSGGGGCGGVVSTNDFPVEGGDSRERLNGAAGADGIIIIRYAAGANLTGASMTGSPQIGSQLAAAASGTTGTPTPTAAFQWQSSATGSGSWSGITGATSSTFSIGNTYLDQYLRAEVTVTNTSGSAVTYTSAIGPIAAASSSTPEPAPGPPTSSPVPSPTPEATPTPAQTSISLPPLSAAPSASPVEVAAGAVTMLVGGNSGEVTRAPVTPAGGFSMSGGGVVVNAVPPPTGFSSGGSSSVVMSGYAPDSSVGAYLFSDPVSLGTLAVGTDGATRGRITIPATISPGQHTLQFTGWNAAGEPVILSAGITVKPQVTRVVQAVPFAQGSTTLTPAGRAAVARAVAASAALAGSIRTTVSYVNAGAPSAIRLAKSRAQVVAKALTARGLRAAIAAVRSTAGSPAAMRTNAVVITSTG